MKTKNKRFQKKLHKELLHKAIFLAACNAILLLGDVKHVNTVEPLLTDTLNNGHL